MIQEMSNMTQWTVKLEGVKAGQEDDITFNFEDIRKMMKPLTVERYILQDLSKIRKKNSHYHELPNVKEVNSDSDDKQSIPKAKTAIILATLKDTRENIGIFLSLANEFKYEVIGLRPSSFIDQIKKKNEKLGELLGKLTKSPAAFEDVSIVLPEARF